MNECDYRECPRGRNPATCETATCCVACDYYYEEKEYKMEELTVNKLKESLKACEKEVKELTDRQLGKSIAEQMVLKESIGVGKLIGLYGAIIKLGNEVIKLRKRPDFTEEELKTLEDLLESYAGDDIEFKIIHEKVYAVNHY